MSTKSFTTGETAPNLAVGTVPGVDDMAVAGQQSLLAIAHLHARLMRNALEINAELLDFARRRVGEDLGASERLSRSRNSAEATEVMSGFYRKAIQDYAEEAQKIVRVSADAARRSIEETQSESDKAFLGGSAKVALPE